MQYQEHGVVDAVAFEAGVSVYDDLLIGEVPVVFRLLGDSVIAGGHQGAVHDQHGVLGIPLAGLEGEHRPEVIDDPVRRRLGNPNSGANWRMVRFVRQ